MVIEVAYKNKAYCYSYVWSSVGCYCYAMNHICG